MSRTATRTVNMLDRPPAKPLSALDRALPKPAVTDAEPTYVIESDVPIPESMMGRARQSAASRMPFGQLEIGQSFHVPSTLAPADALKRAYGWCRQSAKRYPGRRFISRIEGRGVRIWRVEPRTTGAAS